MLAIAERLEGLYSNASTHAAGVVIGDRPLVELVPLYRDPKSDMPATQFNMKWVEPAGLVKFDFLGPEDADRCSSARSIWWRGAASRSISATSRSTTRGPTKCSGAARRSACSRWKARGMRKALVEMRADRFEDLIALVALYRPGPMANIPALLRAQARQGEGRICPSASSSRSSRRPSASSPIRSRCSRSPRTSPAIASAQADILRRAMGKKIKSEMDAQRERFVAGAVERGVDKATADAIFDACAKFAEYGFNKSPFGGLRASSPTRPPGSRPTIRPNSSPPR